MQPFEGIRVLDLTHVLAGPFCTYQLAVMGADVIKIEPPDEFDMCRPEGASAGLNAESRGLYFAAQGANKRAITLNLKAEEGQGLFKQFVESADVLVENYRGGVMAGLGLGYEALKAINPRLIYCSMTGFGHTGPKGKDPAYDNVIQAFSGLMAATGTPDVSPVRVGPPVLDYGTGAQAAFAISAALFRREKSGQGEHIDVAMLDAAMMLMSVLAVETQATGVPPRPNGNNHARNAGYACYHTKDGLLMVGAYTGKQHARLWAAIGRADIAAEMKTAGPDEIAADRAAHAVLFEEIFARETADHWERLLNDRGVPAARVRKLDEALAHPQLSSRQVLQDSLELPETGTKLRAPTAAFSYSNGGPALHRNPAAPGEHTEEVLGELGLSGAEVAGLRQRGVV